MKEAQQWLNEKYSLNQRGQLEEVNNNYGEELTGELIIENFPNLKRIHLAKNKSITKLIIRNCPHIKKIDIANNRITEITINELTNLEYLNCSNNQLNGLDISQNTKIKSLLCSGNPQLSKENFKGVEELTQLSVINCDDNLQPFQILQVKLQKARQDLEDKTQQFTQLNSTIISAQNNLGISNLNQLPIMPSTTNLQELINLYQTRSQVANYSQTGEFTQLQQHNQELQTQIQELQEQLASLEILTLEEKIKIQKNYLESLKVKANNKLNDVILQDILAELLEDQDHFTQINDDFTPTRIKRNQRRLLNSERLTEQEINKLLQARINLTKLEVQQSQNRQFEARIEVN